MNTKIPLVSVLMPAYNAEKFIDTSIQSILNQTYTNINLLILNDCSTDKTKSIILRYRKQDKRIKYFENETNLGYVKSFNKLMTLFDGEYITFQDADDYSSNNRIKLQVEAFQKDPDLKVCGTNFYKVTTKHKILNKSDFPLEYNFLKRSTPPETPFVTSTFMIKKSICDINIYYNDFFHRKGGEDVYWAYYLIDNYKTINIKEHLYYYLQNPQGVTLNYKSLEAVNIGEIVRFLVEQRRTEGSDYLQRNEFDKLNEYLDKLKVPYQQDSMLYIKEQLIRNLWVKNNSTAIKLLFYLLLKKPNQPFSFYRKVFSNLKQNLITTK